MTTSASMSWLIGEASPQRGVEEILKLAQLACAERAAAAASRILRKNQVAHGRPLAISDL
jgi:hypothetical protein